MKDYDNARKYINIYYYFTMRVLVDILQTELYEFYEVDVSLDLDSLQRRLSPYQESIYERLILKENLSNDNIFTLFKKDTIEFNDLKDEVSSQFINCIVTMIKKENEASKFKKLVGILKSDYALYKDAFEDKYDYEANFITTNISTLKDINSQIEVEIDIRIGKINFILDKHSFEKLVDISNQNHKYIH